jgi:heptaprenyl diphosphate synthase
MNSSKRLTRTAMLFAVSIILNFIEGLYVIYPAFPGIKLGLSNLPVMFSLLSLSPSTALSIALTKSLFVLITRGVSAGILSLSGGLLSILVMLTVLKVSKKSVSLSFTGILGAVSHNLAQLCAVSLLWGTKSVFALSPILIVSGIIFGTLNAVLLKVTLPYLNFKGGNK